MPLPTPNEGESRDDFISRCMGDPVVSGEFPDAEQRASVCANLFDRAGDMDRAALRLAAGMPLPASTLARSPGKPIAFTYRRNTDIEFDRGL